MTRAAAIVRRAGRRCGPPGRLAARRRAQRGGGRQCARPPSVPGSSGGRGLRAPGCGPVHRQRAGEDRPIARRLQAGRRVDAGSLLLRAARPTRDRGQCHHRAGPPLSSGGVAGSRRSRGARGPSVDRATVSGATPASRRGPRHRPGGQPAHVNGASTTTARSPPLRTAGRARAMRPSRIRTIRSAASATPLSWVTRRIVWPPAWSRRNSSRTS